MSTSQPPPVQPDTEKICFFYNQGLRGKADCNKGDDCTFKHEKVSDEVFNTLKPPSRSNSPAPEKAGPKTSKKSGKFMYCRAFLNGTCTRENCRYPHLSQLQVDAENEKLRILAKGGE